MNANLLKRIPFRDELAAVDRVFRPQDLRKNTCTLQNRERLYSKVVGSLDEAVRMTGLRDGMTIAFHHYFNDGDYIVNMVVDKLAELGFRDLVLAASSLRDCHAPLIRHIKSGVIRRIETCGLSGPLADEISRGLMEVPVVFRSHGGRAYAIEAGMLPVDVAFIGAMSCDPFGNANGYSREKDDGLMCGSMSYAKNDAQYAKKTVILTDSIVPYPNMPFGIPQKYVDYIVEVGEICDSAGMLSEEAHTPSGYKEMLIAELACEVIGASGLLKDGFSLQVSSDSASLAVARFLRGKMLEREVHASFALGGITGFIVDMHEEGLVRKILDVHSFDLKAAQSLRKNRFHQQLPASWCANSGSKEAVINQLDVAVLSAREVDCDFNVNVLTGADGTICGAVGGHPDAAYGASVSVVVTPLVRERVPCVVKKVNTVVTPGKTVDVVVTDRGIAVSPLRAGLLARLQKAGLPVVTIEELAHQAESLAEPREPADYTNYIVGVVTYGDGAVIDLVRQVHT